MYVTVVGTPGQDNHIASHRWKILQHRSKFTNRRVYRKNE